jgi:NADH-quinone oxidoreductase subunit E
VKLNETEQRALNLAAVAEIVSSYAPFTEGSIISALQDMQAHYGYLPREAMDEMARLSGVPVAKFYGVATFYAQFHFTPHGKHTVRVCRGTACHVRGAPKILDTVSKHLGIQDGETTPDMLFSLETVACLGTCFLSPVMLVDSKYYGNLAPEKAVKVLEVMAANHTGTSAKH